MFPSRYDQLPEKYKLFSILVLLKMITLRSKQVSTRAIYIGLVFRHTFGPFGVTPKTPNIFLSVHHHESK